MAPPTTPSPAGNGVLPAPAAILQKKNTPNTQQHTAAPKSPAARRKVVLRRLAPGLTQAELEAALGEEWKLGGGKVDWFTFKSGKVSKEYVNILFLHN